MLKRRFQARRDAEVFSAPVGRLRISGEDVKITLR